MYLSLDRADNYRAEEQRKVKVETGKFWSVTKTLLSVSSTLRYTRRTLFGFDIFWCM